MESLPYEQKVEILRRLPRDGLLAVAQTSTAMLDAASDERLWREGGFAAVTSDEGPSAGGQTDRRDASTYVATDAESVLAPVGRDWSPRVASERVALNGVARWIARVLRFPAWALCPMLTHERNSPFHLRVSLHPMKQSLAAAETLGFRRDEGETLETFSKSTPPHERAVAAAGAFAAVAERLAEVLRDDADDARRRLKTKSARVSVVDAAAAAAESIRAERGSLRVRLSASFLVGVHGNEQARGDPRELAATGSPSRSPPPWSRGLRAEFRVELGSLTVTETQTTNLIARAPKPATPWSLARARLVGEALAALARSAYDTDASPERTRTELAWGGATRAVAAAARDEERLGSQDGDAERNEGETLVAATDAVADARAGVAWPALVRDPRPAITRMTRMTDTDSAMTEDTDVGAPEARPRGFIVGGCACRDRVAAVVHGALAASDTASFLDGDGDGDGTAARRLSADHRAGATALAVLACAPRAHECALGGGRFARLLGRASWTLRLRDALANGVVAESSDASASDPRERAFETRAELDTVPQDTSESPSSPSFFFVPDATESDACLALWLERSAVALADARARWEPREAAEAATELAAAAAATARAAMASGGDGPGGAPGAGAGAGAGAGSSRDARGGSDRLRAARRVMLRRARETLDECLVAVGVLEERGGAENT